MTKSIHRISVNSHVCLEWWFPLGYIPASCFKSEVGMVKNSNSCGTVRRGTELPTHVENSGAGFSVKIRWYLTPGQKSSHITAVGALTWSIPRMVRIGWSIGCRTPDIASTQRGRVPGNWPMWDIWYGPATVLRFLYNHIYLFSFVPPWIRETHVVLNFPVLGSNTISFGRCVYGKW